MPQRRLAVRPWQAMRGGGHCRKLLAGRASFAVTTQAVLTHGGRGYAREYEVERLIRVSMLTRIAPITERLVLSFLAEKVLDLPKSY